MNGTPAFGKPPDYLGISFKTLPSSTQIGTVRNLSRMCSGRGVLVELINPILGKALLFSAQHFEHRRAFC